MSGCVFDAGAFIAFERSERTVVMLTKRLLVLGAKLVNRRARAARRLFGIAGARDVIDAAVVLSAREHGLPVATSDPNDLRRLDPRLRMVCV